MIKTAPYTMSAEIKIFFEWEPKNNQSQASVFVKSLPLLLGYSSSGFPTENLEFLLGSFILDGPGTLVFILQPCKTPRDLNRSSGCHLPIVDQQGPKSKSGICQAYLSVPLFSPRSLKSLLPHTQTEIWDILFRFLVIFNSDNGIKLSCYV